MEKSVDLIPEGLYCYTINSIKSISDGKTILELCPYWAKNPTRPEQDNGYCHFIEQGDWEMDGMGLLWDQCKECEENMGLDEFDDEMS